MTATTFNDFGLPAKLAQALARIDFMTPTPVQAQTIPLALAGKDVLGSAQTGTGKTGAFGIPVIAGLMARPDAAALIMTPTRELAAQVIKALEPMIPVADIRTALLIGGEAMPRQLNQLRHNPRLIVGTPGRINDHLERGSVKLGNVRFLVLDETDRMLDMGFGIQIERILKHVPSDRQTLLFSATLPPNIAKLSGKYMRDPARVAVGSTSTPLAKIKQEVIHVQDQEKYPKLLEQLGARKGSIIIFVKTKYGADKLARRLDKDGHRSDAIHGDLRQRQRDRVIQNFRDERFRVLVATDVAARGLDIPHIQHVINYDMPQMPEDYIHRVGRTARNDAEGAAVSFVTSADNQKWRAIQRLMGGDSAGPEVRGRSGGGRNGGGRNGGRVYDRKPRREENRDGRRDGHRDESRGAHRPEHKSEGKVEGKSGHSYGRYPGHARGKPQAAGQASDWTPSERVAKEGDFADRPQRAEKKRFGERPWDKSGKPREHKPREHGAHGQERGSHEGKSRGFGRGHEPRSSEGKSEGRSERKSEGRFEARSERRPEKKSEGRFERKFEGRKSEGRFESRSEGRSERKPEGRFEKKSEGRFEAKSEGKFQGRARGDEARAGKSLGQKRTYGPHKGGSGGAGRSGGGGGSRSGGGAGHRGKR